jgi:hypothetical protein
MAYYFSHLPTIQYNSSGVSSKVKTNVSVTDITKRFRITQLLNNREVVYYDYSVQDHDRPDSIAYKLYGDSRLDWVVLLVNEIHDRYFQFPLNSSEFDAYIAKQYGSIGSAQSTVHHYERIVQARKTLSDGTIRPEMKVIVDQTTYDSLSASDRRSVSVYDQEFRNNEKRRNIKLVSADFIPFILTEAGRLYS